MNAGSHRGRGIARLNLLITCALVGAVALIYWMAGPRPRVVNGRTEIVYWTGWAGKEFDALRALIDEYNRRQDRVFVKWTYVANDYNKMRIAFAGGDTPDVCSTVWVDDIADYAERGALTPLDPYLAGSNRSLGEYSPPVRALYEYNGKTYALSTGVGSFFIMYNKKLFREAGLDPERPPATLEEFDRYAEKLTRYRNANPRDGIERLGFAYIGQIVSWSHAWGVDYWDPVRRQTLVDTPRMAECLRWLKGNVDKYGYRNQRNFLSSLGNTVSANNPFLTGQIGMVVVGDWYKKIIEMYAPPGFEWGWFAFPAPEGGRPNSAILNASMFTIPSGGKHKQEAWEFLAWVTAPEQARRFRVGEAPGDMAAAIAVQKDPGYQTPYWQFVANLVNSPNAKGIKLPLFNKFFYLLNRVEEQVLSGEATPEQALGDMRKTFEDSVAEVFRTPPTDETSDTATPSSDR